MMNITTQKLYQLEATRWPNADDLCANLPS
jgi:hypothetical protein